MDALCQVKRLTSQRQKVGHGGTIDPLAQGVLPICFGQATRLMDYVVEGAKRYRVAIELGVTTTTYDAEGQVTKTGDVSGVTRDIVETTLQDFIGVIRQTPPMYSAIKVGGQRLYKLARAGIEVEREARTVEVYNIRLLDFSPPSLMLDVESGRGVYIRSLAHDLGEALGCGGYVTKLERLQCGAFQAEEAVTLERLDQSNASDPHGWRRYLHPIDWVLLGTKKHSPWGGWRRNICVTANLLTRASRRMTSVTWSGSGPTAPTDTSWRSYVSTGRPTPGGPPRCSR